MTASKRSTESATAIKKKPDDTQSHAYVNRLLDLYWGGSERRITGLTLKILAVNVVALLILITGILYLGEYHNNLIAARLQTFQREAELTAVALSESPLKNGITGKFSETQVRDVIARLELDRDKTLYLFDDRGVLLLKTETPANGLRPSPRSQSVKVLKNILRFLLAWLPDQETLPPYPESRSETAIGYPDVTDALNGDLTLSAWTGIRSKVLLSAASPLIKNGAIRGALLLTWEGREIEDDMEEVFVTILSIFTGTLIVTILLSIYLSGLIARPLKKLARAAENIRKGHGAPEDIPDFSDRFDEIGELSLVLRDMTMTMAEKMGMMERFAADVSHELKNPLTSLRSAIETLSVVTKKADKDKLMKIIAHDINRLDRLITDISRTSRLDTELSRQAFEKVDLRALLHKLLQTYSDPLQQRAKIEDWKSSTVFQDVTIRTDCAVRNTLYIWGLEGHLLQVFENLLSNALSFSPKGGTISIRVTRLKRRVSVTVENEGPLIPENKLETIFDRFYSQRPEHESYGQNSGLGLSICKQIVDAHGGQIFAENIQNEPGGNRAGTGVRFTVLLNKA